MCLFCFKILAHVGRIRNHVKHITERRCWQWLERSNTTLSDPNENKGRAVNKLLNLWFDPLPFCEHDTLVDHHLLNDSI